MKQLFQNKKLVIILSVVLAVVLAAGVGILVWQLTKDDARNPNTYTISFVTNGGNEIEPMTVKKGTVLSQSELPVPAKRGELFLTWNTDEALTAPYWNEPIESDMTLYASYLTPATDAQSNELIEATIPFANTDFNFTVRSSVELTNDNIGKYVVLVVNYGHHANKDEIRLFVTSEGSGIYRISGNFAAGGEYIISIVSDAVTFNPEDEMLVSHGLSEDLRTLHFRIIGESYMNGELSDKVADIPEENIVIKDEDSVTISGSDHALIGATVEENSVICVGDADDIASYYKIVGIESTSANGITYTVRPAEIEDIYDRVEGYQWENLDGDSFVIDEEVKQQVIENIANNEQLNNYVKYLTLAATGTPTYQTLSMEEFGEVVVMPLTTIATPPGITVGLDFDARNDNFSDILNKDERDNFVKLTLGISYEVKLVKVGSKIGNITAFVDLTIELWVFTGVGGEFDIGWFEYDIDFGSTVLTQTDITFTIGLQTTSGKKAVNVDDEIEAIFKSAENPTAENLLEQYNELMGINSDPIELFNQDIFKAPVSLLGGLVEISIPIRFVVSLDVEASFTSHISILTGNVFGIRGNEDDGLDAFHYKYTTRYLYRIELRGHIELRAGIEVGIEISLGYNLASVSLNAQTGFYGEIYGYFFYEIDNMNPGLGKKTNIGGAYYFEFGLYLDIRVRAEVCHIKYSGSLWDKKWPLYSAGQKEVLYGFVDPTDDKIIMEGVRSVDIGDTGILSAYVYDITEERSDKNPCIVRTFPFDPSKFEITFSNNNFIIIQSDPRTIHCTLDPRKGGYAGEAIMTVKYTGSQMAFRDAITKYVTIKFSADDKVDWDKLDTTCKVDFTIDGEVIFTREVAYGGLITLQPNLIHMTSDDGTVTSELREHEQEAVYNAGYSRVIWEIQRGTPLYVTKDMSFEAVHDDDGPARRKVSYTVQTPSFGAREFTVVWGETPDLSEYEKDEYSGDSRWAFDYWSVEPGPLTEDGVVFNAIYKPVRITVNVEVAGTTDTGTVYEAKTYSAEINKGGFANKVFEMVPKIGRKTLVFYSDAEYTQLVEGYPTVYEDGTTYYARYENHAYVYFYNQYYQNVLTKKVNLGETITLTDAELALITYCDPAEVEKGVLFTYKGMQYNGEEYDITVTPVSQYSMSVFPVFDKEYKVTFLNGDGSVLKEIYCTPGTELASFDLVPTKAPDDEDDYVFLGWIKDNGAIVIDITEPMTLKPNYDKSEILYTVTFTGADGATTEDGKPVGLLEKYKFSELESVIKAYLDGGVITKKQNGYTFVLDSYIITPQSGGLCTVDLIFVVAQATVTFETDGGTLIFGTQTKEDLTIDFAIDQDGFISLEHYGITPNDAAKTFNGWLINGVSYAKDAKIPAKIGEKLTVTAKYDTKFVVTLVNGGDIEIIHAQQGEQIYLPAQTKDGTAQYSYVFAGWKAADGTVYPANTRYTVNGNATLTAQFNQTVKSYTVTFDANGGKFGSNNVSVLSIAYGDTPVAPAPTRAATATARYEFNGWSPALSAVTGDVTYKAQWKEIKLYTVTFDAGDGQFDSSGKSKVTITVDAGYALISNDFPMDPYKKTDAGYYEFSAWTPAVGVGTVINGNVTYTATYQSELSTRTGIMISDGVNTEDIAAFLTGSNKVSGYSYTLNAEYFGKTLKITAPGLTISGEATDIHIEIQNTAVTLKDLTLSYTGIGHINTLGKVDMTIDGIVNITTNRGGDTLRGDYAEDPTDPYSYIDASLTLRGANDSSKLIINSKGYGIAVYGSLTVENLDTDLTVVPFEYDMAVAIQVQNDGALTVVDSDIVVNSGVVNASQLSMTNSNLNFKSAAVTPGYTDGLYMMNHYMTKADVIITLKNSQISFTHDIAIAIAVTMDDDSSYYINTSMEVIEIISSYSSVDAFLADVNANGYSGMIAMDTASRIE